MKQLKVTHRYHYSIGPFEKVALEILNDRYARIEKRRWHSKRNYAIELAVLDPEPLRDTHIAYRWLLAVALTVAATFYFADYVLSNLTTLSLGFILGGIATLLGLGLLFILLFLTQSTRRLVFSARFSQLPLLEIPLPWGSEAKAQSFAMDVTRHALKRRQRLDRTDQEMCAGELRMLRRLSEEGVIDESRYNKARQTLLHFPH